MNSCVLSGSVKNLGIFVQQNPLKMHQLRCNQWLSSVYVHKYANGLMV